MKHKRILSAVMAMALLGTMQAVAVHAEEAENAENIENIENVENVENQDAEEEPPQTTAPETEPEAPLTTPEEIQTEPVTTPQASETDAPATTAATLATETDATTEVVSSELKKPEPGNFKVSSAPEGSDGESAVISWNPVDGADGYQIYRTTVEESDPDTPTSYTFDVKGTSYQTSGSIPYKETIKVRAFKLVNGERIYSAWSESKTVYLNGMKDTDTPSTTQKPDSTTTPKTTTTTAKTTTTGKTSTAAKSTTASDTETKTGSPKTGDTSSVGLWIGAGTTAAIAASITRKKKDNQ